MSATEPAPVHLGSAPTVTRILRDPTNRGIIGLLGEEKGRSLDVAELQSKALPDAPSRFLRDRLRLLADLGVVERGPEAYPRVVGATSAWTLTPAGRDLHRIHAVISRIVTRAGAPKVAGSSIRRDRAIEAALDALADPAMLVILGTLAAAPGAIDPDALEEACRPVARRTLYRRLRVLQDEGLVTRLVTHEVPRRTHYVLQDRWRPVAGVLLLSAWWELRHGPPGTASIDLTTLLHLVAPVARSPRGTVGSTRWTLTTGGETQTTEVSLGDGGLHVDDAPASPAPAPGATIAGPPLGWAAALVTDDRSGLTIEGDAALADAAITSARAGLLAYVR
jgi:DNA-binding HxlR family transcriptional regulator